MAQNDMSELGVRVDEIIPNGVNLDEFFHKPAPKEKYGVPADRKVVVWSGSSHPLKWHLMPGIVKSLPEVFFVLVFKNPVDYRPRLPNVRILSCVPRGQMNEVYNLGDVFLLPSMVENCNMSIFEAMACFTAETPIMAWDILGASVRNFKGRLIEIETSSGYKVKATPEHPFLTLSGWKPAKYLKEDEILYTGEPQNEDTGSMEKGRIGDIVKKLRKHPPKKTERSNPKTHDGWHLWKSERTRVGSALEKQNRDEEDRYSKRGLSIFSRDNRWGRDNIAEKRPKTRRAKISPLNSNCQFFRGTENVVKGNITLQRCQPRRKEREKRTLSLKHEGLCVLSPFSEARTLSEDKEKAHNSFKEVDRKQTIKMPSRRLFSKRDGTLQSDKMVEPEDIGKIRTRNARNIEVYNLKTLNGIYLADQILVHNCDLPVVISKTGYFFDREGEGDFYPTDFGIIAKRLDVETFKRAIRESFLEGYKFAGRAHVKDNKLDLDSWKLRWKVFIDRVLDKE